ncbi:MAG: hypothetical protein GX027_00765 [Clostridiaceae bacterium]|nr:hypothetical protein [Clostridiaceae bacterium]
MRFTKASAVFIILFCLILTCHAATDSFASGETEEAGYVYGVVRDINPSLGYITLYNTDGSGISPDTQDSLSRNRTFSFAYSIAITRDGLPSTLEAVQPGDFAFIMLDEDRYVARLSVRSYYKPLYGKVYLTSPANLVLRLDDGTYRSIPVPADVPVYRNNRPVPRSDIKEGDQIRMLVQTNGASMHVAGIDLVKEPKTISAIFRGNVEFYDDFNNTLVLSGIEEFVNGRWEYSPVMGIRTFTYSREYRDRPTGRISGKAYIAVQQEADGSDSIVMAAIRFQPQYEIVFTDNILTLSNTLRMLEFKNSSHVVGFDSGTIAVKDGRLVDISSLDPMDPVQLSAERPVGSGVFVGQVVVSNTRAGKESLTIYRGRINLVDSLKSFTVESFAELLGYSWSFSNTPKTFGIDPSVTRLLTNDGTGNMLNFDDSFINQTVYIVEEGGKTLLVSTAPYADVPVRGRVMNLTQTGFRLGEVMEYDHETYIWESGPNREVNVPAGAIVIKNGRITDISSVRPGDNLRMVCNSASHDGIIIIVE